MADQGPAAMSLEVPALAEMAATVRAFAVAAAREAGGDEDLVACARLAASELLANAVQAGVDGPCRFETASEAGGFVLIAHGIGPLVDAEGDDATRDPEAWLSTHRAAILRALGEVVVRGSDVRVSLPSGP
jgi:anti-sigma regulatory factor (Ser/Thr protein kinase)